jgi:DsbE subfamily thiol:disulfide oxidoreductase
MRPLFLLPIAVFALLIGLFAGRLILIEHGDAPDLVPSAMIDRPAPDFDLPPVLTNAPHFKSGDFKGKVTLVNFFASWCVPCRAEHPLLAAIEGKGALLVGMAYKDKPENLRPWLKDMGDPYDVLVSDSDGRTAIDFGVYGVPETYLIDKSGIIRFKQTGPLTPEIIQRKLLPLIRELNR